MRPAREKKRLRRVLVVATGSSRAMRPVQRARLWAITWTASQAALAAKRPRGEMVQPDAVFEVAYRVLDLGVAAVAGLQFQDIPLPVGAEGVIAVAGEQRQLGAGRGPHPADDEPHRHSAWLALERCVFSLSHVGSTVHPVRDGRPLRLGYGLDEMA